jgi:two-component system sensor histidine kinase KdpD
LDALVANLLDMSRLQTGSITSLSAEVDLATVAEWTLRAVPGAESIAVTAPDDLPPVSADPGLLERVIANVVENALKHTDAVAVSVSAWTSGESGARVSLRVVDRGPGVPVESLEAIFEPFQRVGDVPAGDGVGLGLAVARGLMEAMGGTLAAEETPGGGLTLVIDLPAVAGEHR